MSICQHVDCHEEAVRTLEYPSVVPGLGPMKGGYCQAHADAILADGLVFPGAVDVTDRRAT